MFILNGLSQDWLKLQQQPLEGGIKPLCARCANRGLRQVRPEGRDDPDRSLCILMLGNGTFLVRGLEQSSIDGLTITNSVMNRERFVKARIQAGIEVIHPANRIQISATKYSVTQEHFHFCLVMSAILEPASRFFRDSGLKAAGMTTRMVDTPFS